MFMNGPFKNGLGTSQSDDCGNTAYFAKKILPDYGTNITFSTLKSEHNAFMWDCFLFFKLSFGKIKNICEINIV